MMFTFTHFWHWLFLKEISFYNAKGQEIKTTLADKPYTYLCDWYSDCNYKCNRIKKIILLENEINKDTYNINYAIDTINNIKIIIKNIFKDFDYLKLNKLIEYINTISISNNLGIYDQILIYKSLTHITTTTPVQQ